MSVAGTQDGSMLDMVTTGKAANAIAQMKRPTMRPLLLACAGAASVLAAAATYRSFQANSLDRVNQGSSEAPGAVAGQITIRFDANRAPNLPWAFKPEAPTETVRIGARDMAFFTATNNSTHQVTGTATYKVTPAAAERYFTKIQCFCFTEQTLAPGETARMPVIFYVDPKIKDDPELRNIDEIRLSYTFSAVDETRKPG